MNIKDFKTLEDVQRFIDSHSDLFPNILSLKNKKYRRAEEIEGIRTSDLWNLIVRNNYKDQIKWSRKKSDLSEFKTVEDFQKFIEKNSIGSAREFDDRFAGIYSKAQDLGLLVHLSYNNNPNKASRRLFLRSFKTVDDYDRFIKENQLSKPYRLKELDERLYRRFVASKFYKDYKWPTIKDTKRHFILEDIIFDFLTDLGIDFEDHKGFPWLKKLNLDFYIESINLGIECQGIQHFMPVDWYGGDENYQKQIKNDRLKFDLCRKNNLNLLYYSDPDIVFSQKSRDYSFGINNFNNYHDKIYRSISELGDLLKTLLNIK